MHIPFDLCLFRKFGVDPRTDLGGDSRGNDSIDEGIYCKRWEDLMGMEW